MHHSDYVPLHLHTEYSLLDGAIKIDELVETAAAMKMPAVAITDHGNLFGAVEFYRKAVKAGIKPIIGCEVYVAPGSRHDRARSAGEGAAFHLVLLARDNDGYRNLITLVSRAFTEGFYYKPRIDRELLEQYSGGLIGLTACLKGEVPYYLRLGDLDKARETALEYKRILGAGNFFLELQANGLEEQEAVNRKLVQLSKELHIGVVATNDCHYLKPGDARAHEILLCIQTGKTLSDAGRMRFQTQEFYFKSPEEMKETFRDLPEAVQNTRAIAERCNVEFSLGKFMLPKFDPPEEFERPSEYLQALAERGLGERLGVEPEERYAKRLEHELAVIKNMGYSSYFLIVRDFIDFAKKNRIPVGPGRGSAAGSLVAYALGITEIDPMKYGLLFERFLNPERVSMPDIDVDFCKDRRGDVINYVADKYGKDHVAQIITFGTMAARAAIRDVARAMDFPYAEADRLAKLVPEGPKVTISDAIKKEPRLSEAYEGDERVRELLDVALRLEGLSRHASTHAAGVVISPGPLTDFTPLYRHPVDETITTQFDMGSVERLGLIKFDFLGLKTLTIIEKTLNYIAEEGKEFSLEHLPLDDAETFELLGEGHTTGVFQLESPGMREILRKMRPTRFEDLIALVALYRPGPIGSGMIDDFIKRKRGETAVRYPLPQLRQILDETYGVILYQEQVMSIANTLAGFSMGQADVLRKAMGKKKAEEMERQKADFIEGAVKNGIERKKAKSIFDLMAKFAEYGFNKSHSAAYAFIAYQTAYLKAHYPVHFMAATLSADIDNTDKIVKSIRECSTMDIEILPPHINLCGKEFTVAGGAIRFGLCAVKGVGASAIDAILQAREQAPFSSFEDFTERVETRRVNKKVMESLVKAGAFDNLDPERGQRHTLRSLVRWRASLCEKLKGGAQVAPSLGLFGESLGEAEEEAREGWDEAELLRNEKEALGFYISGSPLNRYKKTLALMRVSDIPSLEALEDRAEVDTAGVVSSIKRLRTRGKGEAMAYVTLEDEGSVEVIVFPELYRQHAEMLEKDAPILVKGHLDKTDRGIKVIARELSALGDLVAKNGNGRKVELSIKDGGCDLRALKRILEGARGQMPLYLRITAGGTETLVQTPLGIQPDEALIERVEGVFGKGTLKVV
ncbi:MAG: DNA polymerase III subunit alpha [Nitrospirota bacterium]